jgi:hypothetical protein
MRQQGSPDAPTPPIASQAPRSRFRLPLRSVILLVLAAGMMATAALLVSGGNAEEGTPAPLGGTGASNPSPSQDPAAQGDGQAESGSPFATTLTSGRLNLELLVVPATAGAANQVHVTGLVPDGNVAEIQDLVVTLHPPGGGAPAEVPMRRLAGNHLLATEVPLATPGAWRIELGMRVRETDVGRTRTIDPFHDVALEAEFPVG